MSFQDPLFAPVGRGTVALVQAFGRVTWFTLQSMALVLRSREGLSQTAIIAVQMFWRCLLPVALVTGPVGAMMALQSLGLTREFGVERLLPPLLAATIIRELGPGFSSVMICFQTGAGIAAELGTMRVREELDALSVMGLDSRALVVGPRVLGAALVAPLLNAWGIICGGLAAYVVAVPLSNMNPTMFVEGFFSGISTGDLWMSEIKSVIFGTLIGATSCTFGFFAEGGAAGVGRAANRAVVSTVILVLVANYLINTLILGLSSGSTFQ